MFESKQEIRFQFQQKNPSKLGEITNKYKIVFKTIDDCIGAGPHTLVWINSKGLEDWKNQIQQRQCLQCTSELFAVHDFERKGTARARTL